MCWCLPLGYHNDLENQDPNFSQHYYGMAKSHINIVGDVVDLEVTISKAMEDVNKDEANLEMTTTIAKDVSGDETNLEVHVAIAKDVSTVDYRLDCLNDNRVGDDLKGNDEHTPRTKKRDYNKKWQQRAKTRTTKLCAQEEVRSTKVKTSFLTHMESISPQQIAYNC